MRQWLVEPSKMCRKHLLGEHCEHHMMMGTIKKGIKIDGYLNGLFDLSKLIDRHNSLAEEMIRRGYNHNTPMKFVELPKIGWVDVNVSYETLKLRCNECRKLIEE